MRALVQCFIPVSLILFLNQNPARAEQDIHLTTGFTTPLSTYYKKIFAEINRRYPRYHITCEELSAERALILANNGINGGECCRIPGEVQKQYPNLLTVSYPVYSLKWVAFSTKPLKIKTWEDIKPYNAVILTGWKLAERKMAEVKPVSLEVVRSPEILMRMLELKRADVGIMGYVNGLKTIHDSGISNVSYVSEPLSISPLYLMLNKKLKNNLTDLQMIIKSLERDGTLTKIYRQTISKYQYSVLDAQE